MALMTLNSASWWCRKFLYYIVGLCFFSFIFLLGIKKNRVLKARRLRKQAEVSSLDFDMEEYELNLIFVADTEQS